jgi:signal peptidase I
MIRERLHRWKDTIKTAVSVIFIVLVLQLGFEAWGLEGWDMSPTVDEGDRVLGEKVSYWFRAPRRQEIVLSRHPLRPNRRWIGRVIGLPGERVEIKDGEVRINGEVLAEPSLPEPAAYDFGTTVPAGCYFILGDRRQTPWYSASWGSVPQTSITDRVAFRFWPLRRMSTVGQ